MSIQIPDGPWDVYKQSHAHGKQDGTTWFVRGPLGDERMFTGEGSFGRALAAVYESNWAYRFGLREVGKNPEGT